MKVVTALVRTTGCTSSETEALEETEIYTAALTSLAGSNTEKMACSTQSTQCLSTLDTDLIKLQS